MGLVLGDSGSASNQLCGLGQITPNLYLKSNFRTFCL